MRFEFTTPTDGFCQWDLSCASKDPSASGFAGTAAASLKHIAYSSTSPPRNTKVSSPVWLSQFLVVSFYLPRHQRARSFAGFETVMENATWQFPSASMGNLPRETSWCPFTEIVRDKLRFRMRARLNYAEIYLARAKVQPTRGDKKVSRVPLYQHRPCLRGPLLCFQR